MQTTITATYDNKTALTNVVDDLVNDGLPREKIFADEDRLEVKVIVPTVTEPGITQLLKRHDPIKIA